MPVYSGFSYYYPFYPIYPTKSENKGVTVDYLLGRKEPDPIQAFLASIKAVDSKQFVETYQQLPDIYQAILVDAMKRLSEASITDTAMQIKQRHVERLGDIEDEQEQERQAKDKGGTSCAFIGWLYTFIFVFYISMHAYFKFICKVLTA